MKLSKKIYFEIDGEWYLVQRDLLTYRKPYSILPIPKENFLVTKLGKKDSLGGGVVPCEIESLSNKRCFYFMCLDGLYNFQHQINEKIKLLKEYFLEKLYPRDRD